MMEIVQVNLAVDDKIYEDIISGTLKITAGVVRDRKGVIRKHLPKVINTAKCKDTVKAAEKGNNVQGLKNNKAIGTVIGLAALVGSSVIYFVALSKQKKTEASKESTLHFQKALNTYLKVAKAGALNAKVVDDLLKALEEIQNSKASGAIILSIPANQFDYLINSIFVYTKKLAEVNTFTQIRVKTPNRGSKNNIINLKNYLEIQKQIISQV